jgi:hypothetical protein
MPDEDFDLLGEDDLALLSRRSERMYENRMSSRRNSRTCFKYGKTRHFFAECPKLNDNNKHKSKPRGGSPTRRVMDMGGRHSLERR